MWKRITLHNKWDFVELKWWEWDSPKGSWASEIAFANNLKGILALNLAPRQFSNSPRQFALSQNRHNLAHLSLQNSPNWFVNGNLHIPNSSRQFANSLRQIVNKLISAKNGFLLWFLIWSAKQSYKSIELEHSEIFMWYD